MERSGEIGKLAEALAKAQNELGDATKSATNPHFKSRYADLEAVREAIKGPLSSNGLSYSQLPGALNGKVTCTTILMHSSGQFIAGTIEMPVSKQDAQAYGSAITYARRYSLMAIVGIASADDDDDGNAASNKEAGGASHLTTSAPASLSTSSQINKPAQPRMDETVVARLKAALWKRATIAEYEEWRSLREVEAAIEKLPPRERREFEAEVGAFRASVGNAEDRAAIHGSDLMMAG